MSNIEGRYSGDTLASETMGKRVKKSDGATKGGMTFLSPMYASGVDMCEPAAPQGFAGDVRDPMGFVTGSNFLKGKYGKGKK